MHRQRKRFFIVVRLSSLLIAIIYASSAKDKKGNKRTPSYQMYGCMHVTLPRIQSASSILKRPNARKQTKTTANLVPASSSQDSKYSSKHRWIEREGGVKLARHGDFSDDLQHSTRLGHKWSGNFQPRWSCPCSIGSATKLENKPRAKYSRWWWYWIKWYTQSMQIGNKIGCLKVLWDPLYHVLPHFSPSAALRAYRY